MGLLVAASAHADLYRWIDPDTGSVKLSSSPPSDPRVNAELVTARSGPLPRPPPPSAMQQVAPLETRWREMLAQLAALTPQQLDAFQALSMELDRVDPQGASRRQREALAVLQRLQKPGAR